MVVSLLLPVDGSPLVAILATLEGIHRNVPPERYELILLDSVGRKDTDLGEAKILNEVVQDIGRATRLTHVRMDQDMPPLSYAYYCNEGAQLASGKYLVFLKPGLVPARGWLEALVERAVAVVSMISPERPNGIEHFVIGSKVIDPYGLISRIGVAFDVNNTPVSLYQGLPPELSPVNKRREFKAVQIPFLVPRREFLEVGGFDSRFCNRFEDIDFCLRVGQDGWRVFNEPESVILQAYVSWEPSPDDDMRNQWRFYSKWAGKIGQDDRKYLQEDGLDFDAMTVLYRELAARAVAGALRALGQEVIPVSTSVEVE